MNHIKNDTLFFMYLDFLYIKYKEKQTELNTKMTL